MKKNKLIAVIMSLAMTLSLVNVPYVSVNADENQTAESTPIPTVAPTVDPFTKVVYSEDFETFADGSNDAINQTNGWSYGTQAGSEGTIAFWVGNNGSGSDKMLRFASTDWYKTSWLNLDLRASGIAKYVAAGDDETTAAEKVDKYLSEDMKLSFRFKPTTSGYDENAHHREYIRVKNDKYNRIAELYIMDKNLYLYTMNEDKSADEMYLLGEIDLSENSIWHDVVIEIDRETNTYKLTLDGEVVDSTPWGENIPVGTAESEDKSVGKVSSIEFAHVWSGWWQSMSIDDIEIVTVDSNPDVTPNPDTTPKPEVTPVPTVKPVKTPAPFYEEDFENSTADVDATNQKNGWTYGGEEDESGLHTDYIDFWLGTADASSANKSLRFAGTMWFKTLWANLDIEENGVSKYTAMGYDENYARKKIEKDLSGNTKISFKFKPTNSGADPNKTHEQYIRIKEDDGSIVTELRIVDTTLYLAAMSEDKTKDTMYELGTVGLSSTNSKWHTVDITVDKESGTYKLTFDGAKIDYTQWGENIPMGTVENAGKKIGKVSQMEFGHVVTGWWQSMFIDDIKFTALETENDEWGVESFDVNTETGSFDLTVSAGQENYEDLKVYAVLYNDGAVESIKLFNNPTFNEDMKFIANETFDMPETKGELLVKVFIWHGNVKTVTDLPYIAIIK